MKIKTMIVAALAGGMMPVTLPLPGYAAMASAALCLDNDVRLQEILRVSKPPQSAQTIVQLTNILFVVQEVLNTLDSKCSGHADYSQTRSSYKATYDQTLTTCRQLASDQSVCVPKQYVRPY